jgi:DNA-binding NarL/FixJ family response regulator
MALARILVVEDSEDWRKLIVCLLREVPAFEIVGEALDGVHAIQMAGKMQPTVVLLDIGLPRLNGIQAGACILKVAPGAKIIFVSQEFDRDLIDAAMEIGAYGFVLKSDAGEALIPAIRAVTRDQKFMSDELVRHLFGSGSKE